MGEKTGTLATVLVVGVIIFLLLSWWFNRAPQSWQITINSTPVNGGTTTPAGINTVLQGSELQVNATPEEGYVFSKWLLDEAQYQTTTPSIRISPQAINSSHTLTAVFILDSSVCWEVTPENITVHKGQTIALSIFLWHNGFGDYIHNVKIGPCYVRETPYDSSNKVDVFNSIKIGVDYGVIVTYTEVLEQTAYNVKHKVGFMGSDDKYYSGVLNEWFITFQVREDAPLGFFYLRFSIAGDIYGGTASKVYSPTFFGLHILG